MGGVISVPPWEIGFLLGLVLLIDLGFRWPRPFVALTSAGLIVVIAVSLPIKHLDRIVGPMEYEIMSERELSHVLGEDWDIPVMILAERRVTMSAFRTDQPMTRRKVLQKLANESGGKLKIGYCASAASILFGGRPSYTYLSIAQPGDAENGRNPLGDGRTQ